MRGDMHFKLCACSCEWEDSTNPPYVRELCVRQVRSEVKRVREPSSILAPEWHKSCSTSLSTRKALSPGSSMRARSLAAPTAGN